MGVLKMPELWQLLNYLQVQGFPVVGISADAVSVKDRTIQTTYNNQPIRLDFSETPPTDTTEIDTAISDFTPVTPPDWIGFLDGLAEIDGVYAEHRDVLGEDRTHMLSAV